MADVAPDHSTDSVPFIDYCTRRATKIPIADPVARLHEAVRRALEQIGRDLEIHWLDIDGHEHAELPAGWDRFSARYEPGSEHIFEALPGGRVLYQPRVRERRCKIDSPAMETVGAVREGDVRVMDGRDVATTAMAGAGLTQAADGSEEPPLRPVADEDAADKWPWQRNPTLRAKDGSEPRRIQVECERLEREGMIESSIQHLSAAKICKELVKTGTNASDSSVERAFGRRIPASD